MTQRLDFYPWLQRRRRQAIALVVFGYLIVATLLLMATNIAHWRDMTFLRELQAGAWAVLQWLTYAALAGAVVATAWIIALHAWPERWYLRYLRSQGVPIE